MRDVHVRITCHVRRVPCACSTYYVTTNLLYYVLDEYEKFDVARREGAGCTSRASAVMQTQNSTSETVARVNFGEFWKFNATRLYLQEQVVRSK